MKKKKLFEIDGKWKSIAFAGCICVLCYVVLTNLGTIFSGIGALLSMLQSVFIGMALAYITNPLAMFFERKVFKKIKKPRLAWILSVTLTLLIIIAAVLLLINLMIPQIVESIVSLAEKVMGYISSHSSGSGIPASSIPLLSGFISFITREGGLIETLSPLLTDNLQQALEITTSIGNITINIGVGLIFAVYFMMEKTAIKNQIYRLMDLTLSKYKRDVTITMLNKFHSIFSQYIIFTLLDALIVGVVTYLFMLITGMPAAVFISVICGLTNLIPTFGPIIGAAVGAMVLLVTRADCTVPFLIFTLILQTIDGYVLKPKLFGSVLNVPGILILICIIVCGKLGGMLGMLVAIPVAAIIAYLYSEVLIPRLELKKELKQYLKESKNLEKAEPAEGGEADTIR